MATRLERLVFELDANTNKLRRELGLMDRRAEQSARALRRSFQTVGRATTQLRTGILGIAGALGAIRAAQGLRSLSGDVLDVSAAFEQYEVRLGALLGSQEAANEVLSDFIELASRTPFAVADIVEGATALGGVAVGNADRLRELTQIATNIAAVTGLSFQQTAANLQRSLSAGIGAADLFRERAVRGLVESITGIPDLTKVSLDELEQAFRDVFGEGGAFGRQAEALSATLGGALSNISDASTNAKDALGDAFSGPVVNAARQVLIPALGAVEQSIRENEDAIEDFAASTVRFLGGGLSSLISGINFLIEGWRNFGLGITLAQVKLAEFEIDARQRGVQLREVFQSFGFEGGIAFSANEEALESARRRLARLNEQFLSDSQSVAIYTREVEELLQTIKQLADAADLDRELPAIPDSGVTAPDPFVGTTDADRTAGRSFTDRLQRQAEALRERRKVAEENSRLELAQQERLIEALGRGTAAYEEERRAIAAENEVKRLGLSLDEARGAALFDEALQRQRNADEIERLAEAAEANFKTIEELGVEAAQNLSSALADLAFEGELSFDRIGRAFARNIFENELQSLLTGVLGIGNGQSLLAGLFGLSGAGGGGGSGGGSALPTLAAPVVARAAASGGGGSGIRINVIDQVGVTASARETSSGGFGAREVEILLTESTKRALGSGALDGALQQRFAIRPVGR